MRGLPGGAAQQGLDADDEDVQVEGLGQVVVGAGFEAFEDVFGAGARGEHQDRRVALGVAQGAGDGEAVGAGEHAVEDDDGDVFRAGLRGGEQIGEGGIAVGLVVGAEAFGLEVEEQALGEVFFVFDEGDEGGLKSGRSCLYIGPQIQMYLCRGMDDAGEEGDRPFQAIWTPMQSRMKAMTRRIPWAVEGEMCRAMRCEWA